MVGNLTAWFADVQDAEQKMAVSHAGMGEEIRSTARIAGGATRRGIEILKLRQEKSAIMGVKRMNPEKQVNERTRK